MASSLTVRVQHRSASQHIPLDEVIHSQKQQKDESPQNHCGANLQTITLITYTKVVMYVYLHTRTIYISNPNNNKVSMAQSLPSPLYIKGAFSVE